MSNQFDKLNIDKSKLVLATDKVLTHDNKLDTKPVGFFKDAMYRFAKNKASVFGAIIICFLILFAIIGPWISLYDFDYHNLEKASLPPYIEGLEWLGFDGCVKKEISKNEYDKLRAIGEETGIHPIAEFIEERQIQKGNKVSTVYYCKINEYYYKGVIKKTLTLEEYQKLQDYQNKTGIQVMYPLSNSTYNSPINKYDGNYWYETNEKGVAQFDENGNFKKVYVPYSGNDGYNSLRIEGDTPLYEYSRRAASGGNSFDVRVSEYRYEKYLTAKWIDDGNGGGHYEEGRDPQFWFGSNQYGEDIFTRLACGARFSFLLAIFVSAINLTVGSIYGAIEGYYGGATDMIMERISDILSSIPMYVVISLLKWYVVPEVGTQWGALLSLILAFFVTGWIGMAGSVRRQFYRYKNQEFVMASRTLGASDFRLMFKHIFPNALGTLVTSCVLVIPSVILSESSLSYLGIINLDVGSFTSVGTMLSNGQDAGISAYPHIIFWPALFFALLMISFNLFGNGLRDAFNPSLRGSEG